MSMTGFEFIAFLASVLIALGYLGIGAFVAPKFRFGYGRQLGARIATVSGIVFFVTCALTHVELAYHAFTGTIFDFNNWFHAINHIIQAVAAPVFLIFASIYLRIEIWSKPDEPGVPHG